MTRLKILVLATLFGLPLTATASECVVLLHGWGRITNSMAELETKLERAGYQVANIRYPTRRHTIDVLANDAVGRGVSACQEKQVESIHFVTHSLGGILVRYYLRQETLPQLGRVVMLGPPNHGMELVDGFRHLPGFSLIVGPTAVLLGTGEGSILQQLGPADFDVGIIAGDTNLNPLNFLLGSGPGDSLVSVASTRLEGMHAHIVLPVIHQIMMRNNIVIDHTIHYLKTGKFMPVN